MVAMIWVIETTKHAINIEMVKVNQIENRDNVLVKATIDFYGILQTIEEEDSISVCFVNAIWVT